MAPENWSACGNISTFRKRPGSPDDLLHLEYRIKENHREAARKGNAILKQGAWNEDSPLTPVLPKLLEEGKLCGLLLVALQGLVIEEWVVVVEVHYGLLLLLRLDL
jgi:hypothetical protein